MHKVFNTELAGRKLTIETGKLAQLANGSVLVKYGETVVLVTATASEKPREGMNFFPLSVDYEERLYSVGKIPGSFLKREGRPSERAILTARMIDRPIRPLCPNNMRNDVSIVATVLAVEQDNSPELTALIGASAALTISDIPFNGPVGGVNVGLIDNEYVINPTIEQREKSQMIVTVISTKEKVVMIEAGAKEVPEDKMLEGIMYGHNEAAKLCDFIESIRKEVGKEKSEFTYFEIDQDIYEEVKNYSTEKIKQALKTADKEERENNINALSDELHEKYDEKYPEKEVSIDEAFRKLQKEIVREWIIKEGYRPDGRGMDDIRELHAEVGILERTHGSGLFSRGQTQVLTIATLGAMGEIQKLDGIDEEEYKRYMHHYNFPSYSVGETRPSRGPGRREIGHGALAERALEPVIPNEEEFPYAIRLVSEVLSSNGSTSQGSVCGSTLALMDAGVPIKAPVAGISVGLVTEGENYVLITDIQGMEDFFGDMDFKVAGTKNGITAIQMDIKIDGLTRDIIKNALEKCKCAREYIIDEVMLKAIEKPKEHLSKYAPKIISSTIDPEKIRDVIGPGGKIIQKIINETGVKIDIEDDGKLYIATNDEEAAQRAMEMIKGITEDVKVGNVYLGTVVRIVNFGAFVEFLPGKEGLVHISKLDKEHVKKVEDVVSVGDKVLVKVTEIDRQGRINLSRKDAIPSETNKEDK